MGIDVSLILPVYNETSRLVSGLSDILEYLSTQKKFSWEILIIDDGSNFPTAEVLNRSPLRTKVATYINTHQLRGIRLAHNKGKGGAIRKGVEEAHGTYVMFMDIDGSVPVTVIPQFITALQSTDIAIASRRISKSIIAVHQPFIRETGGRMYTFLSQSLFGLTVHDATCGFKAFQQSVAKDLFSTGKIDRWAFDTEILSLAKERNYSVIEVPVIWENREGSKVKFVDTLKSFIDLLKIIWYQQTGVYMKKTIVKKEQTHKEAKKDGRNTCDTCGSQQFTFLFNHHHGWVVQECTQCGLVQIMPRPTTKEVAALYHNDEGHFDPYIEQESVHRAYFKEKLTQCLTHLSVTAPTHSLLDVGCLTGVLLDEAKTMDFRPEGLDISKDAVTYCNKRGLRAYVGTIEQFHKKYPRKKYDAITAFEIIEHEYSPRSLIETMYTLLNKNGVAMVSTPNHGSWWRSLMGKRWPGYTHPEHLYFFDARSLETLFRSVGFRDIQVVSGDSRPFPLWFLFKRGADYFPEFAPFLKGLAAILKPLPLTNPINPWDDLLIIAKK